MEINTILLILLIVLIKEQKSSLNYKTTFTNLVDILYIGNVLGDQFIVWQKGNIISVYDSYSYYQIQQVFMSKFLVSKIQFTYFDISQDLTSIIAANNRTVCYYNFFSTLAYCDQNNLIPSKIVSLSFLDTNTQFIVGLYPNGYLFANLTSLTIIELTHIDKVAPFLINSFSHDLTNKKIYGILNNGQIIGFDINLNSSTYRQYNNLNLPTGNINNSFYNAFISPAYTAFIFNYSYIYNFNNLKIYNLLTTPPTLIEQINFYISIVKSGFYCNNTFVFVDISGNIYQFIDYYFGQIGRLNIGKTNISIASNYFINSVTHQVNTFIYSTGKQFIFKLGITGISQCPYPQCGHCDLAKNICTKCSFGYIMNSSVCQPAVCQQGYTLTVSGTACELISCSDFACIFCDPADYCLTCINSTYNLTNGKCIARQKSKTTTNTTANTTNTTANTTTNTITNTTTNTTTNTITNTTTNTTTNTITNTTTNTTNITNLILNNDYTSLFINDVNITEIAQKATNAIGKTMSVSNTRFLIQPATMVFVFLEDYWYYIYHDRSYQPQIQLVFQSATNIDFMKLTPQFINETYITQIININQAFPNHYQLYTPPSVLKIDSNNDTQFLKNTQQMYILSYIFVIISFIVLRVLYLLIRKCQQSEIIKPVTTFLKQVTFYKCIIVQLIEGNLIYISFYTLLQISNPSYLNFIDKMNVIFAYLFLFVAILYSFGFYLMVYAMCPKKEAESFLIFNEYSFQGFLCQTILTPLRNLFNGFIHAYLIYNYQTQITTLLFIKIIICIIILVFRSSFKINGFYVSFQMYFFFATLLDLVLFLDYKNIYFAKVLVGYVEVALIFMVSISVIVTLLVSFYQSLKNLINFMIKKCKNNNKIQPQKQNQQKQIQNQKIIKKQQLQQKNQIQVKKIRLQEKQNRKQFQNSRKNLQLSKIQTSDMVEIIIKSRKKSQNFLKIKAQKNPKIKINFSNTSKYRSKLKDKRKANHLNIKIQFVEKEKNN